MKTSINSLVFMKVAPQLKVSKLGQNLSSDNINIVKIYPHYL